MIVVHASRCRAVVRVIAACGSSPMRCRSGLRSVWHEIERGGNRRITTRAARVLLVEHSGTTKPRVPV